ncbi:hypothetical protein BH23VER1_BH23VER1_09760 [soil metagenome]
MNSNECPSCHRPLHADAPAGLCPACVLRAAHESSPAPDLPPIEEIRAAFPQMQVIECIGRGGMGIVYKVYQPHLDRHVALKVLAPDLQAGPGFSERFTREARTLGKLTHPNIVAIHDFGESKGYFWLLMEFVEGVNLHLAMRANRFTPEQALAVIPEVCAALQFAHDRGVLHRDIKPENILLDTQGHVKIADFGIALLVGDRSAPTLTQTGASLGSAAYMAPEQIERPHDIDHRADIYSLGVVFYEMLTGTLPLGRFAPPSEKSGSDPRLDAVVFRALEQEREKRFQSAGAVREGITAARSGPAPAGGIIAPAPARPADRLLPWSLGLLLGGSVAGLVGWFTSATLFGLGITAVPFGLVGCWWGKPDPARGRFRSYLLGAVKHFLAREAARSGAAKRGGFHETVPLENNMAAAPDDTAAFDRDWAFALIGRAHAQLQAEMAAAGKSLQFETLQPWLDGGSQAPAEEAARVLGLTENALRVAIHRLRQRFRELVRAEVEATTDSPADTD